MAGMGIAWFRKVIVIFVVVNVIIFFLVTRLRWDPSWTITNLLTETKQSRIPEQQSEVYWTIPGDNSSLLPFTQSRIFVYIDLNQRRKQVRKQNKACRDIKGDPATLFRSQPSTTTHFTAELDRKRIMQALLCGGVLYRDFLEALPRETLYPFEAFYLSDPPLWNESTVAFHGHSTLSLAGIKRSFVVGDTVSLVITMFDQVGRPRMKGGDRIKVWIKDVKFKHSISTKITDFNNGTYLATTVLPWAGTVRVMATLRQPREYFRALAYVHRAVKTALPFAGAYSNSKASEAVPCNPFPIVPGFHRSELCNLTLINGSPWFCGRPRKQELKCSDYQFVTCSKKILIDLPVTPAEDKLLKQKSNQNNFLKGDIVLKVEPSQSGITRQKDPDVPCNQVSPRSTWHQAVPNGYFYNSVWKSFLCYMSENVDQSCFQNVNMVFYGDSNSREVYYHFISHIQCQETLLSKAEGYHTPKLCVNNTYNFSIEHIPHDSPFHLSYDTFSNHSWLHSPERVFGSIPSTGRHMIIIDRYLHLTTYHISVLERALAAVREAIIRLLQRNPEVFIIFRGPHVAEHVPYTYFLGDAWAQYYIAIQRETFKDLQDSVIYLPTWDMTVAYEDTDIHPKSNYQISHVMLQFLCGRVNRGQ